MTYYYQELTEAELETIDDYEIDEAIEYDTITDYVRTGDSDN